MGSSILGTVRHGSWRIHSLVMPTAWDRAAAGYLKEWAPRFVPYHLDLVRELSLHGGERVFVPMCGPGAEVVALARVVGDRGFIRATDSSGEMIRVAAEKLRSGGFETRSEFAVAEATDASGGPWEAIVCAFGLWQLDPTVQGGQEGRDDGVPTPALALRSWAGALSPQGKIGILVWGPSEDGQPFELLRECARELEPSRTWPNTYDGARRESMRKLLDDAGLEMVRHSVVRHTLSFRTAELFMSAMRESCTMRRMWEELGDARFERIARAFYEHTGGPDVPLTFRPPATLVIATHLRPPGASK